jgi:hypothetical protein
MLAQVRPTYSQFSSISLASKKLASLMNKIVQISVRRLRRSQQIPGSYPKSAIKVKGLDAAG